MTRVDSKSARKLRNAWQWSADNLPAILLLLTLALFISKSLYNVPVAIMAILGAWKVFSKPSLFSDDLIRSFILLFAAVWLPMAVATVDAVNLNHTARTTLPYLRYLFAGIYLLQAEDRDRILNPVMPVAFVIATFWSLDGVLQYLLGKNIVGYPYQPGQITGMFYPRNTIAHVLAALSPFYFECLRRYSVRNAWVWLLCVPVLVVILLSGRRAAWIMLALSISGYYFYLWRQGLLGPRTKGRLFTVFLTMTVSALLVIAVNKPLQDRIAKTTGLFSMDYETMDIATARRLPIWETALLVFQDNWINGIGPRGFRHVYTEYSSEEDIWHESGTTHPHQMLLEVLAETGVIGLIGLTGFVLFLFKLFRRSNYSGFAIPSALSVFVVLFPVNTSMAFYGSYWSSIIWWLIMIFFLAVSPGRNPDGMKGKTVSRQAVPGNIT